MAKPKLDDVIVVKFTIQGNEYSSEEGKIVRISESDDKSTWLLKVKTVSGTYTVRRKK